MRKVVVLGTAHSHVYALAQAAAALPGVKLTGVYESNRANHELIEQKLSLSATDDLEQVLALKPDLALIGAVPCDRAGLAQRAIAGGAAALMDKPIALTHDALEQLIAAQQHCAKPVIVYFPYRGDPMVQAAKAALDQGVIGQLVRVVACGPHQLNAAARPDWFWTKADNGGAMIDIGSHHADICCYFANQSPCWISSQHVNRSQPGHGEFQDFAQAQLRFPGGELAYLEVDWLNPESMKHFGDTRFWLQGTKGKIELRLGDEYSARLWTHDVADQILDAKDYPSMDQWTSQLIDDLLNDRPCAIAQEDVWRGSRVSLHAFDSAENNGKPVEPV